ncbi:MAG: hypothetical protein JOY64_04535 [Alphaproteobacteria bacterium]|nr:hypothetical protein [Alphaproteobacteria bacterium]MBV8406875.1 hypothetical protein [Alphaproteobacteria bacterium]
MANEQRRFGDLLLEALDEMSEPVEQLTPAEIDARVAELHRQLAQARREIDEEDARQAATLTEQDVIALVEHGKRLTHAQQRLLFADAGLRELFRSLKQERAVALPPAEGGSGQSARPRVLQLPAQIAAATEQGEHYERTFEGVTLKIDPVGIDRQVYVVFTFDDPSIATRRLFVERPNERVEPLDLPPPDDREIMVIKDLAVAADAELVALLRDPTAFVDFQR